MFTRINTCSGVCNSDLYSAYERLNAVPVRERRREAEVFFDNDATTSPTHCWPCSIATHSTRSRLRRGHGVWSLRGGQRAAQPWRGVSREGSGRDTIVPRWCYNVTVWYQCWPSELRSHSRRAPLHTSSTFWRVCVCCQDVAAELELSCDLFSRQLETAEHSVDCCSAHSAACGGAPGRLAVQTPVGLIVLHMAQAYMAASRCGMCAVGAVATLFP